MNAELEWYCRTRAERTVKALKTHGFRAEYFETAEKAASWILAEAEEAAYIGVGGSMTIRELGVLDALEQRGKTIFDHWKAADPQESIKVRRAQLTCDLFLCSANAITETGELVNMDGAGNRIAAMGFGPRKVIIASGINKIVPDIPHAYQRIREVAAPINARRLGFKTPCAKTGQCSDCESPQRICNVSLILHRRPPLTDMAVGIIGETLGY